MKLPTNGMLACNDLSTVITQDWGLWWDGCEQIV